MRGAQFGNFSRLFLLKRAFLLNGSNGIFKTGTRAHNVARQGLVSAANS